MVAIICLLRGVNLGGHKPVKMDVLRALCDSLGLCNPQTHVQSGNVVFTCKERSLPALTKKLEAAIEKKFGFHSDIILRTTPELKDVVARNPFAGRKNIEPSKLIVTFLADEPGPEIAKALSEIKGHPEEIHIRGREVYVYYPDGMGRSKLVPVLTKALKNVGTARNWNTVTKLLEMSENV